MKLSRLIIAVLLIFSSWKGDLMAESSNKFKIALSDSEVAEVGSKKIFFGHQSVGYNILDGISDLASNVRIVEADTAPLGEAWFAHARVGENGSPVSKMDDFNRMITEGYGDAADICFLKLCYVDVGPDTETEELFDHYKRTVAELKKNYPDLIIVHFTVPLTAVSRGPKAFIKKLIGRQIKGIEDNIRKEEYNTLVRNEYGGKDPVFDIAEFESTKADGSRNVHKKDGMTFYSLLPEYTDDGGHLNELGRSVIASKLIIFLSEIDA